MTITSGFFDSINDDRLYNAKQMSEIFNGIIRDGVFSTIGNKFVVNESSGMDVLVGTGRAWFAGKWIYNDSDDTLTIPTADPLLPRIDLVCLQVNEQSPIRETTIFVNTGIPNVNPVAPVPEVSFFIKQLPLAYVRVNASVTAINQTNITNLVGTSMAPFVTGPLESIDVDLLFAQWTAQWLEWFNAIKGQLTTEQATNLQAQIWDIVGTLLPPEIDLASLKTHNHIGETAQIPTAGIAPNAVDEGRVGNRVLKVKRRQGVNATDWSTAGGLPGGNTYTPGMVTSQCGATHWHTGGSGQVKGYVDVVFPLPFAGKPLVFTNAKEDLEYLDLNTCVDLITTTGFRLHWRASMGLYDIDLYWFAVGPEVV